MTWIPTKHNGDNCPKSCCNGTIWFDCHCDASYGEDPLNPIRELEIIWKCNKCGLRIVTKYGKEDD